MSHEHIGPYRLLAQQGAGVHRAAGPDGRDVAIRLLPPETRDRLRADLKAMRNVRSPYVVDVLDADPDADRPYLVSRFVPGRPLDEHVAEQGALTGADLGRLAVGLAKALAAIHETGLSHRALRPRDILVVDGSPVVIDFAIAEPAHESEDVRAWAEVVAFAATGGPDAAIPSVLEPLLWSATDEDPAARPSPADLITAVAALDLQPATAPAPPKPKPAAAPAPASSEPGTSTRRAASGAGDTSVVVAAAAVPRAPAVEVPAAREEPVAEPVNEPVAASPRPAVSRVQLVAEAWARLLSAMVVVIVAAVAMMMPVLGIVLSVAAVVLLRMLVAPTGRERALSVGRTLVTLPYAAACGAVVTLGLVALSLFGFEVDPLAAAGLGAAAGVAALWAAPGVRGPRLGMQRLLAPVAPRGIAVAGVVLGLLAFMAVVGAISLTPSFAPMYGLQSSVESAIARWQSTLG
ncbi:protein kinase [Actinomadura barringtoniae]|uniref:Protein kinase n=1 Tax=Actinomadura barringtoniae TaxID=1427535 RepID=A0A939PL50_9ACTN|nr:protein kinase [Actinomadura barringtoniae]MBO2450571.1 protein kinase [Actinomadura barringtoniae]